MIAPERGSRPYRIRRLSPIVLVLAVLSVQSAYLSAQPREAGEIPPVMSISVDAGFRYTRGLEQNALVTIGVDAFPEDVFGFGAALTLASNPSFLRTGDIYVSVAPLKWAATEIRLGYGNYRTYNTAELNSGLVLDLHTPGRRGYTFSLVTGINGRFALFKPVSHLPRELLFGLDFNWALVNSFRVGRDYTMAFEIGSFHRGRMSSFGYVQMELRNLIVLSESWKLLVDTGAGFAGTFSLAGHINRYWIFAGAEYAW